MPTGRTEMFGGWERLVEPHSGGCRTLACHWKHHVSGCEFAEVNDGRTEALNDSVVIVTGNAVVHAHHRARVVVYGNATVFLWDNATCDDRGFQADVHRFDPIVY